jgi:hypothetical protein
MTNLIAAEALLDRAKWGNSPWAPSKSFSAGVGDLLNQFVGPRRRHWYVTHSITKHQPVPSGSRQPTMPAFRWLNPTTRC